MESTRAEAGALGILQVGSVAVVLAVATYNVYELDRFFVPKELILHLTAFLAGLLALGAARRTAASRIDLCLIGYIALGVVSAALAVNPWLAARALAVSVSGVVVFWVARGLREAGLARPLLLIIAVAIVLGAITALLQSQGIETRWFSINRAPGGTLGNRNFIAHLMAFGFPVLLLVALRAWRIAGFLFGCIGIALALAALVLTRSRAAWLGLGVVLAVLLIGMVASRPLRRDWRTLRRLAMLLVFAGIGIAASVLVPNALNWRSDTPYLETAKGVINYQEGSGRGRMIQYRNSLDMALAHPLVGVGPGNWAVRYVDYAASDDPSLDHGDAGRTANPWPSSDWFAFLSERGLPAVLLLVAAYAGIAAGAWRGLRTARDADEGIVALTLLATLVGVVTVGIFDAVLLLAWPTLLAWAALGALWRPEVMRPIRTASPSRVLALASFSLLAGVGAVHSALELGAMSIYANGNGRADFELASDLDPGSYRVNLRLARDGAREQRCEHARAAHGLFPNAVEARRLAARCD